MSDGADVSIDTPAADAGGGESTEPASTQAPAAPQPPKFSLAIDGTEKELTAEELVKHWDKVRTNYSKGLSASQMMTKAEQRLRQAQEFEQKYGPKSIAERFRNPDARAKFLEELGLDRRQLAEELLMPEIQQEMLSAEERRILEAEQRAQAAERKLQEREELEQRHREEQAVKQQQEALGQQMVDALKKVGLPEKSAAWGVRRMAALMDRQIELGLDISVDDLATLVREDFQSELRSMVGALDGSALVEFFGKELVQKIRSHDLAALKARQFGATQPQTPAPAVASRNNGSTAKQQFLTPEERDRIIQERLRAFQQE